MMMRRAVLMAILARNVNTNLMITLGVLMKVLYSLILFIQILGFMPEHSQAQRVSGGGTDAGVNERLLNSLLDPQQDILKRALSNYLTTLNEDQIGDPIIKELMQKKFKKNDLLEDIKKSNYIIGSLGSCKDEYNNKVAAAAIIGQVGGPICFDTKTLAKDYIGLDTESTLIKLASLTLHEHIHHLQPAITHINSNNRNKIIADLEDEGFRFSAYVLITAKSATQPTLKWSQEVTTANDPTIAQKDMCNSFSKQSNSLKFRIKAQKEIVQVWKDLRTEANTTYAISNGLAAISTGILTAGLTLKGGMAYMIGRSYMGGSFALLSTVTIGGVVAYATNPTNEKIVWKEPFYATNYIIEIEKLLNQIDKAIASVSFDYSSLANGLSFGAIAATRIGQMTALQMRKEEILRKELDFINPILASCYSNQLR